ncbi:MAG TPA: hypothetical protein VIL81_07505 [Candidatus Limnocylindrales bacterium]
MDPAQGPVTPPGDRPTPRRRAWLRVGLISAVLWIVIGLAVAFVTSHLPGQTVTGWLPVLTGPVILRIVGRRQGLHDSWSWTQAGLLQLGVVILVISVAIYAVVLGGFLGPGDSSSIESVGFGTGGTDCDLTTVGSTFAPADPIRSVAEFSPELPAGTVITMRLSLGGKELYGYRETLTLDTASGCISGPVSDIPLAAGHYRWAVSPDSGPEAIGEFDIVP